MEVLIRQSPSSSKRLRDGLHTKSFCGFTGLSPRVPLGTSMERGFGTCHNSSALSAEGGSLFLIPTHPVGNKNSTETREIKHHMKSPRMLYFSNSLQTQNGIQQKMFCFSTSNAYTNKPLNNGKSMMKS